MAELRSVDPASLIPNPNNPRRTAAPKAMDDQLVASIRAVGIIQPPRVVETDAGLMVVAGNRRRAAAIAASLPAIDVLVCDADEAADAMRAVSENLIRASMTGVDIWRAIETLEGQGWNEQAISDALALPVRTVRKLKLLAHLHPPMLDVMATSMPSEDQLRTIAAASREEQAQVWKKHKPKKGQEFYWHEVARVLAKRRIPFTDAKFDDELARAYGIAWHDDLFAPAGEDSRYTTDVDAFFAAQQEWLANNLPPGGTLLPTDQHGQPTLPKKAQQTYSKPGKGDLIGHYLDHYSGKVRTIAYRLPEPVKAGKTDTNGGTTGAGGTGEEGIPTKPARPEVTQKGKAMIGDLRTAALHEALLEGEIDDGTLLALLVLALAGNNVSVQTGADPEHGNRYAIMRGITEGGALTADTEAVRGAARSMLVATLSCRDNMTNSGGVARIAGDAVGASLRLPNMATEEFLSCLSKAGVEKAARDTGVRVEVRARDTRGRMVERFKTGCYVHPTALFRFTEAEMETMIRFANRRWVPGTGTGVSPAGTSVPVANGDGRPDGEGDATPDDEGAGFGIEDDLDTPELAQAAAE